MSKRSVDLYFDYKSPFSYLAKDPAYQLEVDHDVEVNWKPYTIDLISAHGDPPSRTKAEFRKVKYLYMDARRWANKRGLIVRGPQKVFDTRFAVIGALFAQLQGTFRAYNDAVFERFFKREFLDIEDAAAVADALKDAGSDVSGFDAFLDGEGVAAHERIQAQADEAGVFGVPTFILDGELFWGHDRIAFLNERLAQS